MSKLHQCSLKLWLNTQIEPEIPMVCLLMLDVDYRPCMEKNVSKYYIHKRLESDVQSEALNVAYGPDY